MRLAITSIQKNRAPWLKEWVAFHYLMGFQKFYIYLHNCTDGSEKVLRQLAKKFDIKIHIVDPNMENPQLKCYQDAYAKYGSTIDWMAFIDGDEFLFPTVDKSIEDVLKKYSDKKLSALGVYWACFGSSGYIKEPSGLIIENYKYRATDSYPNNRHIKSIVKGQQRNIEPYNPHLFETPLGTYDENLRPINKGWTDYKPTYKYLRINHYVTQSRSHFDNFKNKTPHPDGAPPRDESFWEEHNKNDILDNSIKRFKKPLKKLIQTI